MLTKLAIYFGTQPNSEAMKEQIRVAIGRETSHRVTNIINYPETATGTEALAFAKATGIPLPRLVHEYNLAKNELAPVVDEPERLRA